MRHRVALPLHPEYRTLPMVWYIPPLSPVADVVHAAGYDDADPDHVFATIDALRIPIEYLANLFTAGDAETSCSRCCASSPRSARSSGPASSGSIAERRSCPRRSAPTVDDLDDLYRLLAIAKYDDRYVDPARPTPRTPGRLMGQHEQLFCSLDTEGGPGMGGAGPARHPHGIDQPDRARQQTVPATTAARIQPAGLDGTRQRTRPFPGPRPMT